MKITLVAVAAPLFEVVTGLYAILLHESAKHRAMAVRSTARKSQIQRPVTPPGSGRLIRRS
jgi:hypothetical protein